VRLPAKRREGGKQKEKEGERGVVANPRAKSRDNGEYFPLENRIRRSTARYKLLVLRLLLIATRPRHARRHKAIFFRFREQISKGTSTKDSMRDRDLLCRTRRATLSHLYNKLPQPSDYTCPPVNRSHTFQRVDKRT